MQQLYFNAAIYAAHGIGRPRLLRRGKGTYTKDQSLLSHRSVFKNHSPRPLPSLHSSSWTHQENRAQQTWHFAFGRGPASRLSQDLVSNPLLTWVRVILCKLEHSYPWISVAPFTQVQRVPTAPVSRSYKQRWRSGCHKMMNGCPWKFWFGF